MPFQSTDAPMERARLVSAFFEGLYSVTELAERFGVSRPTVYKWIDRFRHGGAEALLDRSRARRSQHARTDARAERLLVEARRAHPSWGARKLLPYLAKRHEGVRWPAASTAAEILRRHGLTQPRRRRTRPRHPGAARLQTTTANQVWTVDFKGEFKLGNGCYCYPLTVCDAHSRFILGCRALPSLKTSGTRRQFERLFDTYGLPEAIRSDNGTPFASRALCGLSRLSVWWLKLGIRHERIAPGQPQQNGRHERMHRTLKAETTRPAAQTMPAQQARFDAWRTEFNQERPHEALGFATPSSLYTCSPRTNPKRVPEPVYPAHFEVRLVSAVGTVKWKGTPLFVSQTLAQQRVGLDEIADGLWSLYFGDRLLARLDERSGLHLHSGV
ncbi:MAG: IS481 family transposase [Bacteroidota bacterium]